MKLITPHIQASEAAERWRTTYCNNDKWSEVCDGDSREIYYGLVALGRTPNPDDVNRIIGNDSWTQTRCNECNEWNCPVVVRLGDEPDYESATAWVCSDCLAKAMAMLPVGPPSLEMGTQLV